MSMDPAAERDRERRFERRTGRRIVVGMVVGTLVGGSLGLLVGAFVFDPWTAAHWTMAFAGAILGGGIALVQGGITGLEATQPGSEPSNTADPLRAESGPTSTEGQTRAWPSDDLVERNRGEGRG